MNIQIKILNKEFYTSGVGEYVESDHDYIRNDGTLLPAYATPGSAAMDLEKDNV